MSTPEIIAFIVAWILGVVNAILNERYRIKGLREIRKREEEEKRNDDDDLGNGAGGFT